MLGNFLSEALEGGVSWYRRYGTCLRSTEMVSSCVPELSSTNLTTPLIKLKWKPHSALCDTILHIAQPYSGNPDVAWPRRWLRPAGVSSAVQKIAYEHYADSYFSWPHLPDFSKEVTVIINEERPNLTATFHVPETFLTESSAFFRAACQNDWREAKSRVVKLSDIEPDIFSSYLYWVHRGKLSVLNKWDLHDKDPADLARITHISLMKLWILADRLADSRLRNAAMDELIATFQSLKSKRSSVRSVLFTPDTTLLIWSSTTDGRPLRELALNFYISHVYAHDVEQNMDEYHPDFLKDLMLVALRKVDTQDTDLSDPFHKVVENSCYYHEHDEENPEGYCHHEK
jgi:hypothetical protein